MEFYVSMGNQICNLHISVTKHVAIETDVAIGVATDVAEERKTERLNVERNHQLM